MACGGWERRSDQPHLMADGQVPIQEETQPYKELGWQARSDVASTTIGDSSSRSKGRS
jgi:hypothetical protein